MTQSNDALNKDPWLEGKARYQVYYEDTDFSGYVYHANYVKYFERGREELVGVEHLRSLYQRGLHFVVARMNLEFHAPAQHGDVIEITTRMRISQSPVALVEQAAYRFSKESAQLPTRLVSTTIKLVSVDRSGKSQRLPDDIYEYYLRLISERCN